MFLLERAQWIHTVGCKLELVGMVDQYRMLIVSSCGILGQLRRDLHQLPRNLLPETGIRLRVDLLL